MNGSRAPVILVLCTIFARPASGQTVLSKRFPRQNLSIACWTIPDPPNGYVSQIVVFETNGTGGVKSVWQSPLDNSYSPQIHFLSEIKVQKLPLALVQRQTGAGTSELDVIGKAASRFAVLFHTDGFKFDVTPLDGSKFPLIIAHKDADILDVPDIYRWDGSHFVEDSSLHPQYYRELLAHDRRTVPSDASAPVLINLSRIAELSADRSAAKKILDDALVKERSKGRDTNPETLRGIRRALRSLGRAPQ